MSPVLCRGIVGVDALSLLLAHDGATGKVGVVDGHHLLCTQAVITDAALR